jgi:hypothetical protein
MSTVQFTVAEIKLPPAGKERGNIITTDGRKYGCFREKFGLFTPNGTYEAEVSDGQYCNIVSAKLLSAASPQPQPAASAPSANGYANGSANGHGHGNGNGNGHGAVFRTPEQMFVTEILTAYIGAGKCANPAELKDTIIKLREAWRVTFGFDDRVFTPSQAGQHYMTTQ